MARSRISRLPAHMTGRCPACKSADVGHESYMDEYDDGMWYDHTESYCMACGHSEPDAYWGVKRNNEDDN